MLKDMDLSSGSSESLGANMSVALVTTFYGCMLANLVFHPITSKLNIRDEEEVLYKEIIVEGVLGFRRGTTRRCSEKDSPPRWLRNASRRSSTQRAAEAALIKKPEEEEAERRNRGGRQ